MLKFHYFGLLLPYFQTEKYYNFLNAALQTHVFLLLLLYLPFSSVTHYSGGTGWDGHMDISYTLCVLLLAYNSAIHKSRCRCS